MTTPNIKQATHDELVGRVIKGLRELESAVIAAEMICDVPQQAISLIEQLAALRHTTSAGEDAVEALRRRWIENIQLHGLPADPKTYQDTVHCYLSGLTKSLAALSVDTSKDERSNHWLELLREAWRRGVASPSPKSFRFGDEYKDAREDYLKFIARIDTALEGNGEISVG